LFQAVLEGVFIEILVESLTVRSVDIEV